MLLVARREQLLDELAEEIESRGGSAFSHPCNLADPAEAGRLAEAVLERHGHVDIIVSNAGKSIRRWISESYGRFDDIERTIGVNYLGPVRLLLGLLPSMRARRSGHIVNVATIGVDFPPLRWSAYIASKAAFETWLAGVAPEVRADGVTTTSIHLQLVRSPMLGPFRMWSYLPGMSTEEAAAMVARAIVSRPRMIAPGWARAGAAVTRLGQAPLELAMSRYLKAAGRDPDSSLPVQVLQGLATIAAMRVLRPVRPDRLARAARAVLRYGPTHGGALAASAALYGQAPAVIDERGTVSYAALDAQARALAGALRRHFDVRAGQRVGIMCRNHRGFVQAVAAATRLGCDLVPLNSDFAGPQLGDVLARERVSVAIHDEEFAAVFEESDFAGTRILGWVDAPDAEGPGFPTVDALIELGEPDPPPPGAHGRLIMLTSGTTGTPKGATRSVGAEALAPLALAGLLDLARIKPAPRAGEPIVLPPPLFHLYGQIGLFLGLGLGSPIVLRRRFDPEATLEQIERTGAGMLLAVPTMLKRIMDLPPETRERYDTSSLRMIVSGASALAPELATAVMNEFGDILYNGYASTEVGSGTLATPADLRAAPGTVGRPAAGVRVKILDEEGVELPAGRTGRIFVGSPLLFEGYTGGGGKEVIDGLMSSGDVGHFDAQGRLFIDGRDDDMILSGGENVFPQEVEELLAGHEQVADAAVYGVPDPDFGQRLAAKVVLKPDAEVSAEELQSYVRSRLARHKVPRELEFVDELPRTDTGKIQRRRLSGAARPA